MRSAKTFTLTDLCIGLVIVLLIGGSLVPLVSYRAREGSNRIKCASNLRQIGLAMKMYANEETRTFAYPRTKYAPKKNLPPVWGTGGGDQPVAGANPFLPEGVQGGTADNDVTSAMFLILRTQDITTDVFICPSSNADRYVIASGNNVQNYTNWRTGEGQNSITSALSYSYQNPYATESAISNGFMFNDSISADFAIVADINSGVSALLTTPEQAPASQMRVINSPNHDYDGQNVLYADGHVDWAVTPFVGTQNDNIYTAGPNPARAHPGITDPVSIISSPVDGNDTILLPTWDSSVPLPTPGVGPITGEMLIIIGVVMLLLLVVGGGLAAFFIFRKKPPHQPPPPAGPSGMSPPPLPSGGY